MFKSIISSMLFTFATFNVFANTPQVLNFGVITHVDKTHQRITVKYSEIGTKEYQIKDFKTKENIDLFRVKSKIKFSFVNDNGFATIDYVIRENDK